MQIQNFNILDQYRLAYQNSKNHESRSIVATHSIKFDLACDLLCFDATCAMSSKIFLVVPSIFNSHEILMMGAPDDFITALRQYGTVYIIKWHEVRDTAFDLTSYTKLTVRIVMHLKALHNQVLELVGHCLGGVFSLAAGILCQDIVNSLVLLTCPWDFTYLQNYRALYNTLGLDESILYQNHVPAIYLQILFFLLHPDSLDQKLDFYRINQQVIEATNFFAVEAWQFSGHPLSKATYNQLMHQFIDDNILKENLWSVDNVYINPSLFKKPVMLVSGTKDKIVPYTASNILSTLFTNATLYKYDTGHIGYLIGSKKTKFFKELRRFIESN